MAIETWIDEVCAIWDAVSDGKGGYVKSYRVFTKAEFPEALTIFPCVISYTRGATPEYGLSFELNTFTGISEFHLSPSVAKNLLPEMMRFYARILSAAAAHLHLNAKAISFMIDPDNGIEGPVKLQYGSEEPHWGFVVHWTVIDSDEIALTG